MDRIYVSGCGGMLGEAFHRQFRDEYALKCSDIDVNAPWLSRCDIRHLDEYREDVKDFQPDYLFHLGALTDLEYCELHPDEAYETNTLAVENAVWISQELDIPLLYISTAGIFDGAKGSYDDWDLPNPIGHYGRSKYAGELAVKDSVKRYLICRAGWMMGGGPSKDKKFIQKIMRQLREGKRELFIVNDRFGTPTYTHDFAANVKLLIQRQYWGLYNMVCGGMTSRLDVTRELLRILHLSESIAIREVDSSHFSAEYFAKRPESERLENKKLSLRQANVMRDWREALSAYIDSYYRGYLSERDSP